MPDQTTEILGKPVSEMISSDTYVAEDGTVQGTLKYVTGFTAFNETVPSEQEGYYFPMHLTQTGTTMSLIKNGVPRKTDIPFDPEVLLRTANKNIVWTIEVDGIKVVDLDFSEAKFE